MKIIFAILMIMPFFACSDGKAMDPEPYAKIRIKEVFSAMITRDEADRIYSGKILSMEGLKFFEKKYGIQTGISDMNFNDDMLIFGITDNISTRAFQFLNQKLMNKFTLDYADTGVKYKLAMPGEGKKHSFLQIFVLDRIDNMPHIYVKNLCLGGLSESFE